MTNYNQELSNSLQLPVHTLNIGAINTKKLRKIFFQFEMEAGPGDQKILSLVAFTGYKRKIGKWQLGKKIKLDIQPGIMATPLPLPLTLGNLELRNKYIRKIKKKGISQLVLTPDLYTANPHATYSFSDGGSFTGTLDPSPPAPPSNG